jgi:hypothetical protein
MQKIYKILYFILLLPLYFPITYHLLNSPHWRLFCAMCGVNLAHVGIYANLKTSEPRGKYRLIDGRITGDNPVSYTPTYTR